MMADDTKRDLATYLSSGYYVYLYIRAYLCLVDIIGIDVLFN
jgi:hypothetical protein